MNTPMNTMEIETRSVLLADDEEIIVDLIKETIGKQAALLDTADDGPTTLSKVKERDYDILLLDISMPGLSGIDIYMWIRENKPHLVKRIIFISGDMESGNRGSFLRASGCLYLAKPFGFKELLTMIGSVPLPT
ncbi:MAG: response regulator [Deltaproteobacteria bacterium]|nr:response regulator [Deltaproteobacteria bacterium]